MNCESSPLSKGARTKRNRAGQLALLKRGKSDYGGDLLKTRAGRARPRPLSTRETMHLVLRSTKAKGEHSFLRPQHDRSLRRITAKFAVKFGVRIISMANVGNHIHIHLKLSSRFTYNAFIRAITGAIAVAIVGKRSQGNPKTGDAGSGVRKFWDRRPFTRVVVSLRAILNLRDYIRMNELEGLGFSRTETRQMVPIERRLSSSD